MKEHNKIRANCLSHRINWLIRGYVKTNQATSYLAECHLVVQWTGMSAVVEWGYQDLRLVELVEELLLSQQEIAGLVQRL